MKIAFVSIGEAYQVYHGAAVMFELMRTPGISVTFFYNDPQTPHHLERIRRAHGAPLLEVVRLRRSALAWIVQTTRLLGLAKSAVLRENEDMLGRFDAVVAMEEGIQILFGDLPEAKRPARILIDHGAGDRLVPAQAYRARFDLLLVKGRKVVDQMVRLGVARAGHIAATGYTKLDTARRLSSPVVFPERRRVVLYNPHRARGLSSWARFIGPMLEAFAAQDDFNLIVAPHVKLMHRWPAARRRHWRRRGQPNILIDTGSDRCCDNSYTVAADIYVGDVSSQVYEFLTCPRPCVFLNSAGVRWQQDPHFLFWQLGDVVESPTGLMAAIRSAHDRHPLYVERQRWLVDRSLGDTGPDCSRSAAGLILEYMRNGQVESPRPQRVCVGATARARAKVSL